MKVVYIAGPFRASNSWDMEQNIRKAETLALECWRAGFAALCPHTNTRFFQGAADDSVWLEGDLELLKRCDACLMVPGWEKSQGSCAEREFAIANNIVVLENLESLEEYFSEAK